MSNSIANEQVTQTLCVCVKILKMKRDQTLNLDDTQTVDFRRS